MKKEKIKIMNKESAAERFKKQMAFALEVDKIKKITRQTYLSDGSCKENDAEHSWHLALMTLLLSEYSNRDIDILKTVKMVLIHDIVEIDAGDTYAYDDEGNKTKKQREMAAAKRIFGILPQDQADEYISIWEEFEEGKTCEALFAHAMDNIQPIMLNDASEGKSWREHDVHKDRVLNRNQITKKASDKAWEYVNEIVERNISKGYLRND